MAKITKSDRAPKDSIHVTTGAVEFDLADAKAVYETDDRYVIENAMMNPYLRVEFDAIVAPAHAADYDPLDPHQNPAADHLSGFGSDTAIAAAAANEKAIIAVVGGNIVAPDAGPTISETVNATFDMMAVPDAPQFAAESPAPQPADPAPQPVKPADPAPPAPPAPVPPTPAGV